MIEFCLSAVANAHRKQPHRRVVLLHNPVPKWTQVLLCLVCLSVAALGLNNIDSLPASASVSARLTGYEVVYRASPQITSPQAWSSGATSIEGAASASGFRVYPRVQGLHLVIFVPMKFNNRIWQTREAEITRAVQNVVTFKLIPLAVLTVKVLDGAVRVDQLPRAGTGGFEAAVIFQSTRRIQSIADRLSEVLKKRGATKELVMLNGTNILDVVVVGGAAVNSIFVSGYLAAAASVSTNQVATYSVEFL